MDFGDWLTRKRLELSQRKKRKVTQSEIAKAAGISRQYLSFIEAGYNPSSSKPPVPDQQLIRALAKALEVPEEEALHAAGYGVQLDEEEARLVKWYRELRSKDQEKASAAIPLLEHLLPSWPLAA